MNETPTPGKSDADFQRLIEAFDVFNQASESLQLSYRELQAEAHRLSAELATANAELERSLSENESFKNYLRNILESLSNGVLVINSEERITICNPAAASLLGLTAELAREASSYSRLPMPLALKDFISRALNATEASDGDLELDLRTAAGHQKHLALSSSPVIDQQGRNSGLTLVLKDVTRLKELEIQNQRAKQLQAMGEMAVQLAHEIRNPLGSIELFASLLSNELRSNPDCQRWADQIVTGVKFLNNIVTNMLTFTRTSKPQLKLFDLQKLIVETLEFIEPILCQRHIRLERPLPGEEQMCEGDPGMLRQMFLNLFMNALQAMPESGCLSVRVQSGQYDSLQIEVQDTGIGIPAENLGRVFDPFFTTNEKGTGLGLALVHEIVEKHRGHIRLTSEFGKGTRFLIVLPRQSGSPALDKYAGEAEIPDWSQAGNAITRIPLFS